jgi:flagellar motor protein MotB
MMAHADNPAHPVVVAAASLAARGSYREALALLGTVDGSVVERGLLEGKVAGQQHRYDEAVRAFEAVLAAAPQLPEALRGLDRARRSLDRPRWVRYARPSGAVFLAVTVCALVVGIARWAEDGATRGRELAEVVPEASPLVAAADVRPPVAPAPETPEMLVATPGVLVRTEGSERVVEFAAGLFDGGRAAIRADRAAQLDAVGSALQEHKGGVRVVIEGRTDSSPLRARTRYADNTALAFARACAVADRLRRSSGLTAESLTVRALGTERDRVLDESRAERARQRTVSLRVSSVKSVQSER